MTVNKPGLQVNNLIDHNLQNWKVKWQCLTRIYENLVYPQLSKSVGTREEIEKK